MKKKNFEAVFGKVKSGLDRKIEEYSENVIVVSEERRWDYAVPKNYTNYHDGFLWQDGEICRGMPIVIYNGETLFLERAIDYIGRKPDEDEKLLLFGRDGKKYTFIVKKSSTELDGNPSYYDFLSKVKRYDPTLKKMVYPEKAS